MSIVATLEDSRSYIGSNEELFRFWIEQGWKFRRGHNRHMREHISDYKARLKHETNMIREKGFVDYFLMVSDLVRWAKDNGIAVGPGRGSSAGSLVCYLLRITEIDPMQYPMLFERFLDPTRTDEPDIDVDFEDTRRDEVFEYATAKYGSDRVANIINFVRYRGRSALDDIARVYNIPAWKTDAIKAKLIERAEGHPRALKTIEDTYNTFDDVRKIIDSTPALKYAMDLEGNMRNTNIHAAAMVIGSVPIDEVSATYQRDLNGRIAFGLAYDKRDATYLGLLKVDALSLMTMGMIAEVCRWTHRVYDKGITLDELYRLELDDPEVISAFAKGDVLGVFQFEGITTRRICKKVRPNTFQHLADINALARPGANDKGYIENKNSGNLPEFSHDIIKQHTTVWPNTYGVITYEEQILMILRDLGGFDPAELNKMRKVIHDKLGSTAFNEYYERFIKGAAAHGLSESTAESVWNGMVSASGYAFNIAHSVSYSTIAYWSQYLKIHYPAAFYAGQLLKCSDEVRRGKLILEAERHNIQVSPPNPLTSLANWTIVRYAESGHGHELVAGLMSIPGIGPKTAHSMIKWRDRNRDIDPGDDNIIDVEIVDYDEDADWDDETNLPATQYLSPEYDNGEFIDEDMLGVQWADFINVKGIGKKTIQKIEEFCNDPDPFKAYETKRVLDSIRHEFSLGNLPGVPEPTHISLDVPPENTFVTYMGIVRKRKYYDAVEQLQKRTSGELSYEDALEQIDDPHLLKYAALYVEDDYGETIRVAISRKKYPEYAGAVDNIVLNRDVVVVQGFSSDFGGISIQTKSLTVLDPYG